MEQATANFLSIVNDAIDEAGDDLASFAVDGSDFTTNTDPMMNRFKKWVMRAWRDIQQESLDWEWMSEQAVVNITPGIMFYSPHAITWQVSDTEPLIIYDVDATAKIQGIDASLVKDLTGIYTDTENFGYINVLYSDYSFTDQHTLDFGLKAGGEYFLINTNTTLKFATQSVISPFALDDTSTSITITCYDSDHIVTFQQTYDLVGLVTFIETTGTSTAFNIKYSTLGAGFLDDYIAKATTEYQTSLTVNGTTATIPEMFTAGIPPIDSAFTPQQYTLECTGTGIDVVGGTISSPLTITAFTVTISAGAHTPSGYSGTIDAATDATSAIFTLTDASTGILDNNNAFFLFSYAVNVQTVFDSFEFDSNTRTVSVPDAFSEASTVFAVTVATSDSFKNYIHSWKSFDWSEELDDDDFVEEVREVNQSTFRIIYHDDPATAGELPLQFIPWESFQNKFDLASTPPSIPRIITEDNTARYRLYPPPNRPYTILFDYVREPQILVNFDDVPKGLPEEYRDLIMWRAITAFGEYDEQPSVALRAWKNYKTLLMKFEMQTREKFHFKSAYPWGSRTYGA